MVAKLFGARACALLLLLSACATPPPELPTAAELASPHVVMIRQTDPAVHVDPGRAGLRPTPVAGVGDTGLAAAMLTVAVIQAVDQASAAGRRARSEALKDLLGPTGEVGLELDARMREALASLAAAGPRTPILRIGALGPTEPLPPQGEGVFVLEFGAMLTEDVRSVVVQVEVIHARRVVGARALPSRMRYFLAVSEPIQAASEEEAIAAWRADGHALLRRTVLAMVPELMAQLRSVLLDPEAIDYAQLPEVTTSVPGVSVVQWRLPNEPVRSVYLTGPLRGRLVRRTPDRAYLVMQGSPNIWVWLSLPAAVLAGGSSS